jgi:hypothetical protein
MRKVFFLLLSLLLIGSSSVLLAKDAKTNGTVIGRVDRSAWTAIACSSERADDGGGIAALLDGNHNNHWHSQWGPDVQPPHWVIIDLGEGGAREFTAFQIYKRNGNTHYQKNVEIYVSDDAVEPSEEIPLPADNGWTLIGEGQFPEPAQHRMLTVETPGGAANQGRYLLVYIPDSWNTFVVAAEIYGLGPIDENTYKGTPYPGAPHAVPGIIEAEDFDKGGQGVGYRWFDADIRQSQAYVDSVLLEDPEREFDYSNYRWDAEDGDMYILDNAWDDGRHLGHFNVPGEYLNYTINVTESDHYDLALLASTTGADRFFQLLLDDQPLCRDFDVIPGDKPVNWDNGFYPVINTGDWAKYVNNVVEKAYLTAGKHVLRVYGFFDFDKITITKSYMGYPFKEENTVPLIIEAEDFDEADGYTDMTYHVATPGTNTYRPNTTANIVAGPAGEDGEDNYVLATGNDWYIYTINVPEAKSYNYVFAFHGQRAAASNYLVMEINGEIDEELTAHIDFPISYDEPSEIYMALKLKQGKNFIKVKTNGGNLDKIEIMKGPFDYEGTPFYNTPFIVPANGEVLIEAEDFDSGGDGISFHAGNKNANDLSREHRAIANIADGSENVSLENRGTGLTIGNFAAGDWTAYSLDVEEDGEYDILLSLATNNDNRACGINIDGEAYPDIIANTTGWGNFVDFAATNIPILAGRHTLYITIYANFDYIKIRKHSDIFPYENNPQVIPGIIQAWKFDEGGDGLTYSVSDKTMGGENNAIRTDVEVPIGGNEADGYFVDVVGFGTPSQMVYTVDVKETGYYKLTFKVGCDTGGENFTLSNRTASAKVVLPNDPGEWQDLTFPIMKLNEGLDTLKLVISGAAIKIASIEFEPLADVIDRSNWTVEVSDVKETDGGGKDTMFDDSFTTYWHSNYPIADFPDADLPHWAIFDMGYQVEISQIITIRRNNGDTKTLEYSVSNDPNGDEWSIIATGEYAAQSDGIHDLTLDATQIVKARYLQLFLPDSFREIFTGVAEVYVIGKSFEGINNPLATLPGKVYAENGILKVKEFSANASLEVYNILGQKITAYKVLNDGAEIRLPSKGIYIVKVQDNGKTSSYKVVVY